MDLELARKTVIVTGGASGIGRAIALAFAGEGAKIVIADVDMVQAEKTASRANTLGGQAIAVETDVTDYNQVQKMVEVTLAKFETIDVLVNNAGWDNPKPFMDTTPDLWDKIIAINYRSILNCFKLVLPHMINQKCGAIVNIGSDAGRVGEKGESVYAGCKAATIALSKAVAKEVGPFNIRVNVVCPALTLPRDPEEVGDGSAFKEVSFTPEQMQKAAERYYPLRKIAKPMDIAGTVVFLASNVAAGHITGQTLSVDGGYCMM